MKILIVLNPVSGGTSNDKAILRIHEQAVLNNFDFKFLYTTGNNDDEAISEQLKSYKPDRIIAGGGDGTVQLVARNIIKKKIPMAILPLGSANGLATAMGYAQGPVEAVDAIFNATHTRPLDILIFNDNHVCIHLGDIGLNAHMVKEYGEADARGMLGYAKYLVKAIQESPLLHYTIKTPDKIYTKEGYMLTFANAHKYGTGVHISEGSVSDGKFEICNIETIALNNVIKAGLTILNVFVDKNMFSDVISCAQAEIKIDQKTHFQIDGEYIGMVDHLSVKVIPSAISLIITGAN